MANKLTIEDLQGACDDLAMIPYFPQESKASVQRLLLAMCPSREALRWLVVEACKNCTQWPGPAELRGLLCTKFRPADGIEQAACSIPGHTAAENEHRHLMRHQQVKLLENSRAPLEEGWFFKDLSNDPEHIAMWQRIRAHSKFNHARTFATNLLLQLGTYMGQEL